MKKAKVPVLDCEWFDFFDPSYKVRYGHLKCSCGKDFASAIKKDGLVKLCRFGAHAGCKGMVCASCSIEMENDGGQHNTRARGGNKK